MLKYKSTINKYHYIPNELKNIICSYANNKCHICNVTCCIPYKKVIKFYFCSQKCYNFF